MTDNHARAYLNIKMKVVRGIPRFRAVGIFSEQANSMTTFGNDEFWTEIAWYGGKSYDHACKELKNYIKDAHHLRWVKRLMFDEKDRCFTTYVGFEDKNESNRLDIALEHMGVYHE